MPNAVRSIALVASAVLFSACGSALADGKGELDKGRFGEARATFVSIESESRTWNDERRAEYALYRGLTHGALGERASASVWLHEAKAIEEAHPGALHADEMTHLNLAIEALAPAPAGAAAP